MRGMSWGTLVGLLVLSYAASAVAQAVTPGEIRTYSTPQSIGIEWDVAGDENHDAGVGIRYRVGGGAWTDGYPLFRVDFNGQNMLAGSLLFLDGGADHEIELTLTDPDGGGETQTVTVATLPVPALPTSGTTYHVIPGSGGGTGTEADPFQGIEAADAVAAPGDTILVHAGDYGGEQTLFDAAGLPGEYVAWVAADDEAPQIDDIRIRGDYIWIEGFDISAPDNAVRNEGASVGAVIKGNRISGCHYCIHMNTGAQSWWISDNVIIGDQDPASGSLSGEGVELSHTPGHTIAYNSISRAADGVSYPDRNVDIFGNDIFETSDDGVEPDDGYANIRIWNNRISHANNNGITFQPMAGAPWYIIRNQVIGSAESVLKMRAALDRVLLAHNTFIGWARVTQNSVGFLRNMTIRNNLWITMQGDYLWEDTGNDGTPDNWRTDIDYDGFSWPDSTSVPLFKWHDVRYDDLAALQAATSIEQNAIRVPMTCYETLDVPGPSPAVIPPQHVTLADGCVAIDAGQVLPGINTDFNGAGPDLGAHESGAPLLHYGPRETTPATEGATGGMAGIGGAAASGGAGSGGTSSGGTPASGAGTGSGAASGSGGSDPGGGDAAPGAEDDGGCGCRAAGEPGKRAAGGWLLLAALSIFWRRRSVA